MFVYGKCDAVMCEREDRPVEWMSLWRPRLQRRQNPHAAPATAGVLKKDFVLLDDKAVVFSELFYARTSFPYRKDFRVCCATKFSHRTNPAPRFARKTDKSPKIDKSGVETRGAAFGHKLPGAIPKEFAASGFIDRSL